MYWDASNCYTKYEKKHEMYNMMEFQIDNITDYYSDEFTDYYGNENEDLNFVIYNVTFTKKEFTEPFLPNFGNTVYKYQGGKIDKHYNIRDTHKMDIKEMYTSLSRTTELEYIHHDNKEKCRWYREREQDQMITLNSYFNVYYQNGKIYHVTFENNCCGATEGSEQQNIQDLKEIYKGPRILEFITFYHNALHLTRVHCATNKSNKNTRKFGG